ncbi:ABC transporter substrate-binding protein [Paludibacterium purpuratum]|uniref:Putative spermidine/putrescine transport system substrate-binding protein n=1 Tax=Paludibacterium purpuratum TaxID=1144873 RepID=A0A4R7B988_9NEIS|nr:ABC transporter substrate-binding protein [Paludibacterium purpuratum]TDR81371.1 putative spermidine/putrescine transport system substrate-binding protein [Paludibacterium purpuratum]
METAVKTWTLAIAAACCASSALAGDLTVISFGGANKAAQEKAYYAPFTQATGVSVVGGEYNGEMAKVKAMVDTRSVSWDVLEVESPELARGCDEGLFEKLDYSKINKNDFVPGAVQTCGIGIFVWSTVLAYNADQLKSAPGSWKDFWDVKKFPGKRGLRKGAKYTLEVALMADGVAPKDVYKVLATQAGQDRAFKMLDRLKPNIQWWEAGAQPPQYLVSGDVVMSSAYNGRIAASQKDGKNLKIVWNGGMYDFDSWAIPKGSPNKDAALKFIAFASKPENQKVYSQQIAYGPSNKKAVGLLSKNVAATLPTAPQNIKSGLAVDVAFWADYGESLEQRFNAWAAK